MKLFRYSKYMLGLGLLLATTACEDNFLDVNTNPNNSTVSTAKLTLPSAMRATATEVGEDLNILGNLWVGNWAQASDYLWYVSEEQYNLTANSYNDTWTNLYAGSLRDLQYVEKQAKESGNKNYVAIAKILQAYNYQLLADLWGDVPVKSALQGTDEISPAYDSAEEVYKTVITLLDEGIASLDVAAAKPGAEDIIFKGNMAQWKKFANTLKLRVYMRQSIAKPSVAEAGIKAMAGAEFLAAGEEVAVNPGFNNSSGKTNPLVANIGYNTTGSVTSGNRATRANEFAIEFLKTTSDPRVERLYTRVSATAAHNAGQLKGIRNGVSPGDDNKSSVVSGVGKAIIKPFAEAGYAQPIYLMTSSESLFLQAEAVQRGYLIGDAKALYEAGVKASFTLLGATGADAYLEQDMNLVGWEASANKVEAIITQKWIALNGINGIEAWNEFRRTGYPAGNPLSLTAVTPKFPVRIPYVQTELASNATNVPKLANIFDQRIFWDVD
ncbi:SusD-like starch-binding protein associating with outer membrane [Pontibacter ummariensis]|uniref:Starch-binding associating with outer membrane n=1 Tax=Pontibacter ummariensis TaxID=1610492 RepID=A0A239E8F3_9BACT|nr:SusD/RagB family nutrient-binding outer membrane lipoprotein [Pontibacter ummariensis]PRY13129.1 SusD-like starch-binding protein associating with outer membrane [Pontibacter ummariensis]SNS40741.1 Starch-binding associating with outer membrane [Pontibacter ummariensis]